MQHPAPQPAPGRPERQGGRKPKPSTAVVIGGGIAGLVSARELALAGVEVTVLERSPRFGGCVTRHEVGGLTLDAGAESFATRSSVVSDLVAELGLGAELVQPNPAGAWIQLPDGAQRLPKTGVLGIPADPSDPDVVRAIGRRAALRASGDKVMPLGSLLRREQLSLGELVRTRMGDAVLQKLVAPVVGGVYSADPDVLEVDSVMPGLRASVASHGSLTAAVRAIRKAAPAGSNVAGIAGGMGRLTEALLADLKTRHVALHAGAPATAVSKHDDGWLVESAAGTFTADAVLMAADGGAAVRLLAGTAPGLVGLEPAAGPSVALVTLVVDLPELDAMPRGTGLLVAPSVQNVKAKALTHATAKWPWLADEAGPGSHVLRLSYGRAVGQQGTEDFTGWNDDELYRQALADASALMGVAVGDDDVVGWKVVRWIGALTSATVGHRDRVAAVRRELAAHPGVDVTGAWLAGTGLVAVVGDARRRARELAARLQPAA